MNVIYTFGEFEPGWYAQTQFDDMIEVAFIGNYKNGSAASEQAQFLGYGTPRYCETFGDLERIFGGS